MLFRSVSQSRYVFFGCGGCYLFFMGEVVIGVTLLVDVLLVVVQRSHKNERLFVFVGIVWMLICAW